MADKIAGSDFARATRARREEGRKPDVQNRRERFCTSNASPQGEGQDARSNAHVRHGSASTEHVTKKQLEFRRAGRVAEGAPLLRVYVGDCIEGSNPSLSAIFIRMACCQSYKDRESDDLA